MKNTKSTRLMNVRRITVDEKLAPGLIRMLVAELKPGLKEFDDEPRYWKEEKEFLVNPDNIREISGMTLRDSKKWPWDNIYEGQTFLQGYFTLKPDIQVNPRFLVDRTKKNFLCINDMIKNPLKELYFSAIKGGAKNAKTDKT